MITLKGPDGWLFTSERALYHPVERVAVISDVHLGYEWSRAAGGDSLPAHSLRQTVTALSGLFQHVSIDRLIVAGDLLESPDACRRTSSDLLAFRNWLGERGITLMPVQGNHDRVSEPSPLSVEVGGWTISHGHVPVKAEKSITGHLHPVIRSANLTAACFLASPRRIVLPAFSANAAGWNVLEAHIPKAWIDERVRCFASVRGELLDFGPLAKLAVPRTQRGVRAR